MIVNVREFFSPGGLHPYSLPAASTNKRKCRRARQPDCCAVWV